MDQKQIGIVLIIIGVVLGALTGVMKTREDTYIEGFMESAGTCYLTDGTCLHKDRSFWPYVVGWGLSVALLLFGFYLGFIDKTQEKLFAHQKEISSALAQAKNQDTEKQKFESFLKGFSEEEQKLLRVIRAQDGVKQSSLRIKTGLSKTTVSLLLSSLEKRNVVARSPSGKTNQVFLKKI